MRKYERKDTFYLKAKREGFPSRAVYKIQELDREFGIFKPGRRILDLGCAPGGWFQWGQTRLDQDSQLVGVDLLPLNLTLKPWSQFILGDLQTQQVQTKIHLAFPTGADWILSDMSPNMTGIKFKDLAASHQLLTTLIGSLPTLLRPGGGLVFKIFPGQEFSDTKKAIKPFFQRLVEKRPEAIRKYSAEIYFVCLGYTPTTPHPPLNPLPSREGNFRKKIC